MRDAKRIDEICEALKAAWHQYPDLRLGQFLEGVNIFPVTVIGCKGVMMPFFQEDEETLKKLREVCQ